MTKYSPNHKQNTISLTDDIICCYERTVFMFSIDFGKVYNCCQNL